MDDLSGRLYRGWLLSVLVWGVPLVGLSDMHATWWWFVPPTIGCLLLFTPIRWAPVSVSGQVLCMTVLIVLIGSDVWPPAIWWSVVVVCTWTLQLALWWSVRGIEPPRVERRSINVRPVLLGLVAYLAYALLTMALDHHARSRFEILPEHVAELVEAVDPLEATYLVQRRQMAYRAWWPIRAREWVTSVFVMIGGPCVAFVVLRRRWSWARKRPDGAAFLVLLLAGAVSVLTLAPILAAHEIWGRGQVEAVATRELSLDAMRVP